MSAQFLSAVLVIAAPLGPRKAEEPINPYQNAKVGDYAVFKTTTRLAGVNLDGTMTQRVTARDEKTVTVETVAKLDGTDTPAQKQVIDLTKPFDAANMGGLPPGAGVMVEKVSEGKEKMTVCGKEYEARWDTYKVHSGNGGVTMDAEMKLWQAKGLAIPIVKMEMTANVAGMKLSVSMALTETGRNVPVEKESKR